MQLHYGDDGDGILILYIIIIIIRSIIGYLYNIIIQRTCGDFNVR